MSDAVQQIKDRLSVVDVISPYVELHQAGKNFKGKSPFTNEKTPSFYVSPDRGMYYCFSSSQGGDIFTFVEKMEGVDFKGALKILAEKAGVELVPEDPKKRTARDAQYSLLEEATQFFQTKLLEKADAMQYLLDRGVTKETIGKWRIGYAPGPPDGGWRELRQHLNDKKFTDEQIYKAGLVKKVDSGKEPYDVFRDRIMFPIADASGRIVAYSGRILSKDTEAPKYVNSPETDLFNKSEILFGYDKAKQGIRQYDFSLIVEGQFDVVLCHQAGYTSAVAVSGTAMTDHHSALLQRLSNRVVLALDADRAGIAAVRRSADIMLARGIDIKVAQIPEGKDPADIIAEDVHVFKEIISHATHVIEFLLSVAKRESRDERTFKLRARDEVIPYILRIDSHIDREHFEQIVADALSTTKDGIHQEVTRLESLEEDKKTKEKTYNKSTDETIAVPSDPSEKNSETDMRKREVRQYILVVHDLVSEDKQKVIRSIFEKITGIEFEKEKRDLSPEVTSKLTFSLESLFEDMHEKNINQELVDKLQELRMATLKDSINTQKVLLIEAEQQEDSENAETVMQELTRLQKLLGEPEYTIEIFGDTHT